jgi:hypothetical protein
MINGGRANINQNLLLITLRLDFLFPRSNFCPASLFISPSGTDNGSTKGLKACKVFQSVGNFFQSASAAEGNS